MPENSKNILFYGDNLPILREYIADASVDLIYLDPPFNSNRDYWVFFKDESGQEAEAQVSAFEDSWRWGPASAAIYRELVTEGSARVSGLMGMLHQTLGESQMLAYLVMMTARLVELHRVLKPTGSLYLHCDPTASHYLKIVLDMIFGGENFRNEIVWQRTVSKGNVQRKLGAVHDIILAYAKKLGNETWNQVYRPLNPDYVEKMYRYVEPDTQRRYRLDNLTAPMSRASAGQIYEWRGVRPPASRCWVYNQEKMAELERQGRIVYSKNGFPNYKRYLDENLGEKLPDVWTDVTIASQAESLGYPTQKPLALLERIIQASSNPGDLVLDPFCGCGTTIAAAHKLERRWIGIDITNFAIALQKYRLRDSFGLVEKQDYLVKGEPEDLASAHQLKQDDPYQFQWWALSLIKARPMDADKGVRQGKKGKDRGIDGVITFIDEANGVPKRALVQVKSGKVKSGDIRDLRGTLEREEAALGIFITLENPSRDMLAEAASASVYHSPGWQRDYPKVQILTIADLLNGAEVQMPPATITFKRAEKSAPTLRQDTLLP